MNEIIYSQRQEYENLVKLSERFGIETRSKFSLSFNEYENDNTLFYLTRYLRSEWLKKVSDHISYYDISPWEGQIPMDLNGNNIKYCYESLIDDKFYANKFANNIYGFISYCYLYKNGMSALKGTLFAIKSLIDEEIFIFSSLGYFENKFMIDFFKKENTNEEISLNGYNVFVFEPIKYSTTLENSDIYLIKRLIKNSKYQRIFIIIDMTLTPEKSLLKAIVKFLNVNNKKIIFINIRSMVKLDQEGLELCNMGFAEWIFNEKYQDFANYTNEFILRFKGIMGENVNLRELCLISNFSCSETYSYTSRIKELSSILKKTISESNMFSQIAHGDFEISGKHYVSPFVISKLDTQIKNKYLDFVRDVSTKFSQKGMFMPFRNSFGFRNPSIETFTDVFTNESIVKFYPGCFSGATFSYLCDFISRGKKYV